LEAGGIDARLSEAGVEVDGYELAELNDHHADVGALVCQVEAIHMRALDLHLRHEPDVRAPAPGRGRRAVDGVMGLGAIL